MIKNSIICYFVCSLLISHKSYANPVGGYDIIASIANNTITIPTNLRAISVCKGAPESVNAAPITVLMLPEKQSSDAFDHLIDSVFPILCLENPTYSEKGVSTCMVQPDEHCEFCEPVTLYLKTTADNPSSDLLAPSTETAPDRFGNKALYYSIPVTSGLLFLFCDLKGINIIDKGGFTVDPLPVYFLHHVMVGTGGAYFYFTQPEDLADRIRHQVAPVSTTQVVLPLITFGYAGYELLEFMIRGEKCKNVGFLIHSLILLSTCGVLDYTGNLHFLGEMMMLEISTSLKYFRKINKPSYYFFAAVFTFQRGVHFPYIMYNLIPVLYDDTHNYPYDDIVTPTITTATVANMILNLFWIHSAFKGAMHLYRKQ